MDYFDDAAEVVRRFIIMHFATGKGEVYEIAIVSLAKSNQLCAKLSPPIFQLLDSIEQLQPGTEQ